MHPHSIPSAVSGSPGSLYLELENGAKHGPFEYLINAIGRTPETAGLELEQLGVKMVKHKYIGVDAYQNTSVQGIFAVGDCCGKVHNSCMTQASGYRVSSFSVRWPPVGLMRPGF